MKLIVSRQQLTLLFSSLLVSSSLLTTEVVNGFSITSSSSSYKISQLYVASDIERPPTFLDDQPDDDDNNEDDDDDDFTITFLDESDNGSNQQQQQQRPGRKGYNSHRWKSLNPKIKQRLIEEAQARAIANKKKREPAQDKKRRLLMHFKKLQTDKKRAARVTRPLAFDKRTPLEDIVPGIEVEGVVISLTKFGAYVDIGTECDGLLHISQMTRDFFVEHPRQFVSPGDNVTVTVKSTNPTKKKLHLSMLPKSLLEQEQKQQYEDEIDDEERITLDELQVDDELWGELKRVTDFGAYVEVGAVVDGWLHFMDHPAWDNGDHPSAFMKSGDRVRVWVSDIDLEQNRLKVTALRPTHLPGPRREF